MREATAAGDSDNNALLRLVAAGGSAAARRHLLELHGQPAAALHAGPTAWRQAGLDARQVQRLQSGVDAGDALERARGWLAMPGHALLGWHDPDYPPLLRRISSPPLALFIAGDPAQLWRPSVAVVGSRAPSAGGREHAFAFSRALTGAGLVVASGCASGVDAAAHRGALAVDHGITVAVLGSGPDMPYPSVHGELMEQIAACGAVVSEYLPGTRARREFFPSRNRILAGLSLATVVIEAGLRSGALITARQAADAGREVFALPGSIRNPLARGCHRLIRDGATLVESPEEIVDALAPIAAGHAVALRARLDGPTHATQETPAPAAWEEDPDYKRLWQALGHDPTPMDQLADQSGLTAAKLSSMLLVMELEGRVSVEHGRYARK